MPILVELQEIAEVPFLAAQVLSSLMVLMIGDRLVFRVSCHIDHLAFQLFQLFGYMRIRQVRGQKTRAFKEKKDRLTEWNLKFKWMPYLGRLFSHSSWPNKRPTSR